MRSSDVESLMFRVVERPVLIQPDPARDEPPRPAPRYKAILNQDSGRLLAIVSHTYRLVTNREALNAALRCCRTVFPDTAETEWHVEGFDAPGSGASCHMDLLHNSAALDFLFVPASQKPEIFGPFIRVTNSYNTSRALAFNIGFYRKLCKNGLVLPTAIISFKFTHLSRDIGKAITFKVDSEKLATAKRQFNDSLTALRDCQVDRSEFDPLLCRALRLRPPATTDPQHILTQQWNALSSHVSQLAERYAKALGENAYAALNTITDFASHPPSNRCLHRDRHSLQRLAGSWLVSFTKDCRQPGFTIPDYLSREELSTETSGS